MTIFSKVKDYINIDWSWTKRIPPYFKPLTWSLLGFLLVFWVPMGIMELFFKGPEFFGFELPALPRILAGLSAAIAAFFLMITKGRGILTRLGGAWLEAFSVGWLLGNQLDAGLFLFHWLFVTLGLSQDLLGHFS